MSVAVVLRRGNLYLPREIYDQYLSGLATVVLQRRDDDLAILPVHHAAAGGYLLKQRNSKGDRVVNAADFFRLQGLDEEAVRETSVRWDEGGAALIAAGVFSNDEAT